MKKVLLLIIGLIALGCSKSEDKNEDSSKLNLKGTKWTATDDIDSVFWSKGDNKLNNKGRVSGSVLTTKQRTHKTSNVIYTKQ